jgi:cytoskeletal protein CcmA (bactofilin family)
MFNAKERDRSEARTEAVISLIGPGMEVRGDLTSTGTIRIQGQVAGNVRAEKAVVVGKEGAVEGDIFTQDAVISGEVKGLLMVSSRLEVHASAVIDGGVRARRIQVEEGARLNGEVRVGDGADDAEVESPGSSLQSSEPSSPSTPVAAGAG